MKLKYQHSLSHNLKQSNKQCHKEYFFFEPCNKIQIFIKCEDDAKEF